MQRNEATHDYLLMKYNLDLLEDYRTSIHVSLLQQYSCKPGLEIQK